MKRILVIKLGALGDFVLALGPFKAIREYHADAHITLLTTPAFVALAQASGYFDTVLPYGRPGRRDLQALLRLVRALRGGGFEMVYDLQTSLRSSFYYFLMLGRRPDWSGIAPGCSHRHRDPNRNNLHTVERQAGQLALAGIASVPPADVGWARAGLGRFNLPPSYALLVPGGSAHRPQKRWPAQSYGELTVWLAAKGVLPVILGSGSEQALADAIEEICPQAVSFVDRTDFLDIIALGRGARCAIGNDTGPMHLIAASGCQSLVLFSGASDPALCAPRGGDVTILRPAAPDGDLAALPIIEVAAALKI